MNKKTGLFKNSIIFTAGNLMLKAISFFLIPLYTSYLSTEQYGIINLTSGFYAVAATIVSMGLQYAVIRFYADYKQDADKVRRMNGTVFGLTFIAGVGLILLSFVTGGILSKLFFEGLPFFPIILLSVVIAATNALYTIYQDLLKGMSDAVRSMRMSYFYFFLHLGLNILLIVRLGMGAVGALAAIVLSYVVMIILLLIDLIRRKLIVCVIDRKIAMDMLRYSFPLVPHSLAFNVQVYATKLIISGKLSIATLGVYSLASQFGVVADVVLNSVQNAFQPWMFGIMNNADNEKNHGDLKHQIANNTYMLMWVYGLMFILIGIFSQEAIFIMAKKAEFRQAWMYVPVIVVVTCLKLPLYFYNNFLYYNKQKTKYVFISTLVGAVINIFFTWCLVPVFQIYGSIIADLLAMIVRTIMVMYVAHNDIRETYSMWRTGLMSLLPIPFIVFAMAPAYIGIEEGISLITILIKIVVVTVYAMAMVVLNWRRIVLAIKPRMMKQSD